MLAVILTNCYAPSPRHRIRVFLDRLNEPSDNLDILINIATDFNRRPIQHCFGCTLSGPRIGHVNGHVELPQRRPRLLLNRYCPPAGSNLSFLEDRDDNWLTLWQWNCQSAAKAQPPGWSCQAIYRELVEAGLDDEAISDAEAETARRNLIG